MPGGMENAGAIFFRDDCILLDRDSATPTERYAVARLVAHELAHHWLGDLVTPRWWDDLWLSEATATFAEREALVALHPEWHSWLVFGARVDEVMADDELKEARAVRMPVANGPAARESFNGTTYVKGAAILHMLDAWLGAGSDTSRTGRLRRRSSRRRRRCRRLLRRARRRGRAAGIAAGARLARARRSSALDRHRPLRGRRAGSDARPVTRVDTEHFARRAPVAAAAHVALARREPAARLDRTLGDRSRSPAVRLGSRPTPTAPASFAYVTRRHSPPRSPRSPRPSSTRPSGSSSSRTRGPTLARVHRH